MIISFLNYYNLINILLVYLIKSAECRRIRNPFFRSIQQCSIPSLTLDTKGRNSIPKVILDKGYGARILG